MSIRVSHAIIPLAPLLGCVLAAAAVIAVALPENASAACTTLKPRAKAAPYLLSPCDGASVAEHHAITFIVYDSDVLARRSARDRPYLDLALQRTVTAGQLAASTNGTGVFQQLLPRRGHPHEWTLTVRPQSYRAWWDNHPGTCFVQIRQLDPAATDGISDSPIVSLHVAASRR